MIGFTMPRNPRPCHPRLVPVLTELFLYTSELMPRVAFLYCWSESDLIRRDNGPRVLVSSG